MNGSKGSVKVTTSVDFNSTTILQNPFTRVGSLWEKSLTIYLHLHLCKCGKEHKGESSHFSCRLEEHNKSICKGEVEKNIWHGRPYLEREGHSSFSEVRSKSLTWNPSRDWENLIEVVYINLFSRCIRQYSEVVFFVL